jgi:hypothetical protein
MTQTPTNANTEQLALVEDHAVPPLSLGRYLRLGVATVIAAWSVLPWRMARFVVALPAALLPAIVAAWVIAEARGHDVQAWLFGAADTTPREQLVSAMPVLTVMLALLGHVILKAAFESALFAGLRRVCLEPSRRPGLPPASYASGFFGLALLDLGLLAGTLLFSAPILRVILRVASDVGAFEGGPVFIAIAAAMVVALVAAARLLIAVASSLVAWRPAFVAAALVTAVWTPVREWRTFGPLLVLFALGYGGLAGGVGALLAAGVFEDLEVPRAVWFAVAFVQMLGLSVLDATVVGIVGHRLGDIRPSGVRGTWQSVRAEATGPLPFSPHLPGAFQGRRDGAAVVSFDDVLGPPGGPAGHQRQVPSAAHQ